MSSRQLIIPSGFTKLTPEEKVKIVNGAGPGGRFDFVPDTMYGLNLNCAADVHDYMYYSGMSRLDKIIGDCVYLFNMFAHIEKNSNIIMSVLRKNRALTYVEAVNAIGDRFFFLEEKGNHLYSEDDCLIADLKMKTLWIEIIKKFVLFSVDKKIIFKSMGKSFEYDEIYTNTVSVISALIYDYELKIKKKVISNYEKKFRSKLIEVW